MPERILRLWPPRRLTSVMRRRSASSIGSHSVYVILKPRYIYVVAYVVAGLLLLASALVVVGYLGMRFQNDREALRWDIEIKVRAPIYANPSYPYGSQSPPNPIIGYLEVGSKPDVRRMEFVEPWPYWEVQLESGVRGYLFAPDVEVRRR